MFADMHVCTRVLRANIHASTGSRGSRGSQTLSPVCLRCKGAQPYSYIRVHSRDRRRVVHEASFVRTWLAVDG